MTNTKIGVLSQTLASLNPWWRSSSWAASDPDLRAVRGSGLGYRAGCLDDLVAGGLYVLRGPRRVGKTVAAKQEIERLTSSGVPGSAIIRVAVDGWAAGELRTLIQNVPLPRLPEGATRWWFIDEISGVMGDWASAIKWLRDNYEPFTSATVVVTGSNASKLTEAIGLWAGRRGGVEDADRTMLPIGFRTFANLVLDETPTHLPRLPLADLRSPAAAEAFDAALPWLAELVKAWDLYLGYGGYPVAVAAARRGQPIPRGFIDDLFNVIFKDVFAESRSSETATTDLFARVMAGMGSPANLSSIGESSDLSNHAVARHIDYLRNGYLAWTCPQKDADAWVPLPKSQSKIYAVDPAIARLPHLRRAARPDVDLTALHEMMTGAAIRRAAGDLGQAWAGDEFLFHHRTPARKEIDFVSELLGDAAVEAKFIEDGSWHSEAATVEASGWQGILVTRNVMDTRDPDRAWAVPGGVLGYLLDS